ncbi:hypothetical protein ACOSQ2_019456 [Xanthoceras sorbifolium]
MGRISQLDAIEEVAMIVILYLLFLLRPTLFFLIELFILFSKKLRGVIYGLIHPPLHIRLESLTPLGLGNQLFLMLRPRSKLPPCILKLLMKPFLFRLALFSLKHILMCKTGE